jgi:hypothetical protein
MNDRPADVASGLPLLGLGHGSVAPDLSISVYRNLG